MPGKKREKAQVLLSEKLSHGIILPQKRENLKFPRIGKASLNHEVKSMGNKTSLVTELTQLVIIQLV